MAWEINTLWIPSHGFYVPFLFFSLLFYKFLTPIEPNYKSICWERVKLKEGRPNYKNMRMNVFKKFGQNIYCNPYILQIIDIESL